MTCSVSCVACMASASTQSTVHLGESMKRSLSRRVASCAYAVFASVATQCLPVCIIWRARNACAPVPMSRQRERSFCVARIACVYALLRFLSVLIALCI